MSLLTPWTALLAAALAVPVLLLLYFLKLRRRRLRMASTMLWRRSFEDLQVNTPFQRLRFSALFVLQLLLLLLLIGALAEPVITSEGRSAARMIILIDQSASMSTRDDPGEQGTSRLDEAKAAARRIVDRLAGGRGGTRTLVIAVGRRSRLVCGFEARRALLLDAIDSIGPTDEDANLDGALELAGTFMARGDEADDAPTDVVLISDGGLAASDDPAGFSLRGGRFRFVRVGPDAGDPVRNVGVASLSARRDYEDPTQVLVFARMINTAPEAIEVMATLSVDGVDGPVKRMALPAAADRPGEASATFAVELPGGAVIGVRHGERDALPADDTAAVVLPAPMRPRIVLVHGAIGADPALEGLLEEWRPRELRLMTVAAFDATEQAIDVIAERADLVVFDRVVPSRLPDTPSITIGALPPDIGARPPSSAGGKRILSWQRQHAIMRHVALDTVRYAGFGGLELPVGGVPLATGPDGPVIGVFRRGGVEHVVVGFELARSNWTTHISITVFLQNVLDYLMLARSGHSSIVYRPGAPIDVRSAPGIKTLAVRGAGLALDVPASDAGAPTTIGGLRRVGVYAVTGAEPPHDVVAVSMLSDLESDLRTRDTILVNAEPVVAGAVERAAPRGIWTWFVALAFLLLVVEWVVYCRLARG